MTSADYSDQHAAAFVAQTREADMSAHYTRLLDFIAKGGVILDAGSGSGRDTAWFLQQGYRVDASAAMVKARREHVGIIPLRCGSRISHGTTASMAYEFAPRCFTSIGSCCPVC